MNKKTQRKRIMDDFFGDGIGLTRFKGQNRTKRTAVRRRRGLASVQSFLRIERKGNPFRVLPLLILTGFFLSGGFILNPFDLTFAPLSAQEDRHILTDQAEVGVWSYGYKASGQTSDYYQPVRLVLPEKAVVQIAGPAGFVPNRNDPGLFGLKPGEVYRFKVSEIPYSPGRELYPTLEMLGRLSPPAGHENEFPVPVEMTQEDLDLALSGNLVTRVIFLEPPRSALPVDSTLPAGKLQIEAPASINPVALAESRGRLMAVLRVGSRIPEEAVGPNSAFYFGLPAFTLPTAPIPTEPIEHSSQFSTTPDAPESDVSDSTLKN